MNLYRIIDANINRSSEGVRVLEDMARFIFENPNLAKDLRHMRHNIRKSFNSSSLISSRDSENDPGFNISQGSDIDKKEDLNGLIQANFKRVQEALRSMEEALKVMGHNQESKIYENLRFKTYSLEKRFLGKSSFPNTDIYGILGEEFSLGRSNFEVAREMILSGIKVIQYREKHKSKLEKFNECRDINRLAQKNNVIFIINDDVDIALAIKASGVHIGQEDMPISQAKKISGNMLVGLSTHNKNQALEALEMKADYIGVGPIFNTTTKKNIEASEGLDYLKWVSENIPLPHVAIGGIKESNIIKVKNHGGRCFAMISEIVASENISKKIVDIRQRLKGL